MISRAFVFTLEVIPVGLSDTREEFVNFIESIFSKEYNSNKFGNMIKALGSMEDVTPLVQQYLEYEIVINYNRNYGNAVRLTDISDKVTAIGATDELDIPCIIVERTSDEFIDEPFKINLILIIEQEDRSHNLFLSQLMCDMKAEPRLLNTRFIYSLGYCYIADTDLNSEYDKHTRALIRTLDLMNKNKNKTNHIKPEGITKKMDSTDFRKSLIDASSYMAFFDEKAVTLTEPITVETADGKLKKIIPTICYVGVEGE